MSHLLNTDKEFKKQAIKINATKSLLIIKGLA